ncbi:TPA: hypothetical protein U3L57_000090 [Streptococcus agalactiae]|nr:hypothetical protein [Streptococcus agalactiae]
MKPIKELTIKFKENESVPEVILNGVNLNESGAGLISVNLNWFTKNLHSIDELLERNVSIEYYDKMKKNSEKDMTLCELSQSFKL